MAGLLDILGSTAEGIGRVRARIQEPAARMRGKLLDELAAAAEERRQNQGQQAYGKAAAALNLNAPDIGAIALLARADPAAASGLLSQAAQSRTPLGQQQLQNAQASGYQTEQAMALNAAEEARRSQAFPLQQRNLEQSYQLNQGAAFRDQQRLDLYRQGQEAQIAAAKAQGRQVEQFGGLTPPQFLEQADQTRAVAQGVGAARGIVKLLQEYGNVGKLANPQALAQIEANMFAIIPALQKSLNAGGQNALGTEEREFLEDFMGNPQGFLLRPSVSIAKMTAIAARLESDLTYRATTRSFLPPDSFTVPTYDLPPNLVPLGNMQPQSDFYGGIGRGETSLGWGIPR
jgi:hypothetical protein